MRGRHCIAGMAVGAVVLAAIVTLSSSGPAGAGTFGDPGAPPAIAPPDRDAFLAAADVDSRDDGAQEASRAITVTPDTDLVDGQEVTVDGSGFGGDSLVGILQCAKGLGLGGCDIEHLRLFNPHTTTFSEPFRLRAVISTETGPVDCRSYAPGCRLIANGNYTLQGAARADLTFDPDAPLLPPPTVTAEPSTDLADGQVIQLSGTNAGTHATVALLQCPAGASGDDLYVLCDNSVVIDADATGAFETAYQVEAVLTDRFVGEDRSEGIPAPDPTDCRAEACELLAVADGDPNRAGRTALSFDPDAPLRPDMAISVVPNQDLVDGQVVEVHAAGMTPNGPVDVIECSLSSDLDGSGCELDRVQHLTADADGEVGTTHAVNDVLDTPSGTVDCRNYGSCILVAVDRSVPIDFGRGYVFSYLDFAGDDVPPPSVPADPVAVAPAFTG